MVVEGVVVGNSLCAPTLQPRIIRITTLGCPFSSSLPPLQILRRHLLDTKVRDGDGGLSEDVSGRRKKLCLTFDGNSIGWIRTLIYFAIQ
jgi:hypothetical protein